MKRNGSSLLLTLLVMTTVGAMLLTVSKAFIDNARFSSTSDSLLLATRAAQAGLEEGLQRMKTSSFLDGAGGEYGDGASNNQSPTPANPYQLLPLRRGFVPVKPGIAKCQIWSTEGKADATNSNYDPDCPYYDLTVRNTVNLSPVGNTYTNAAIKRTNSYTITGRDFGPATSIDVLVREQDAGTFGQVAIQNQTTDGVIGCTLCSKSPLSRGESAIVNNNIVGQKITLSLIGGAVDGTNGIVITNSAPDSNDPGSNFAFRIPKTYIDVTGYAGGVTKKLLYTVYSFNTSLTPNLNDSAVSFDPYGFLTQ